ncbi:MAG: YfhO family protein [Eubacterium sp.]|nr:YfhO family protein [Eubacterium sp.]
MSNTNKSYKKILIRYSAYILSFMIPAIVIALGFIRGGFAPFGDKDILNIGRSPEMLYKYYEMYDHFKASGLTTYSSTIGITHDYISDYFFNLSDPTNLIILLFSKESIPAVIDILYLIKVSLCSLSFFIFLNNKRRIIKEKNKDADNPVVPDDSPAKGTKKQIIIGGSDFHKTRFGRFVNHLHAPELAFSIAFSLSQYFISEGTNTSHLLAIALVPIICMGIDNIIYNKSSKLYLISLTVSIYFSFYISMITLLLSSLYYVVNISIIKSGFVKKTICFFVSTVCSVLFSLPVILSIVTGNEFHEKISLNFVPFESMISPWEIIRRLAFNPGPSVLSPFDNGINIYFGLIGLLLFISFFINPRFSIKKRLIYLVFVLFILSASFISTTNYLFNGFHSYSSIMYVFGFFSVFIILSLAYESFLCFSHVSKIPFTAVTILLSVAFMLTIWFSNNLYSSKTILYSLEILLLYYIISLVYIDKSINRSLFYFILSVCCMGEIIFSYSSDLYQLGNSSDINATHESRPYKLYKTVSVIHDNDKGATIYDMDTDSYDTNPMITSIMGFDYLITDDTGDNIENFYTYKNDINAYENVYKIKSIIFDSKILSYKYNTDLPFDSANILAEQYLNAENIFISEDSETASLNVESYINLIDSIKQSPISAETLMTHSDNTIYQDYDNGYIYLPVVLSKNLSVSINGKKADTYSFINNTALIALEKGDNTIALHYTLDFFFIGIILSVISLITYICIIRYTKRHTTKSYSYKSISTFIKDNIVYVYTILIFTLIFILCQMISCSYPFGKKSTIIDDGILQIYTDVIQNINLIKNGKAFTWINQDIGINRDMYYATFTRNVMHFWDLILVRLIPEKIYMMYFTFVHYVAYLLNPLSIIYYLTHKHYNSYKKSDLRLVLIGCLYGLSSYAIFMYIYEGFRLLLYTPLIILGMERIIYEKKPITYIVFLSFMMMYEPYYAFQLCELLVLYFITYKFDNFSHFVKSGAQFALSSVISAGIAAFRLFAYYSFATKTGYSSTDTAVPSIFSFFSKYIYIFNRYLPLRWGKATNPDNSRAAIYIGILALIFIPLYILNDHVHMTIRIKRFILLALLFFAFNNSLLNFILHGFHHQTLVPNRFAYFFIFILIVMISDTLLVLKEYDKKSVTLVISLVVAFYTIIHIAYKDINYISTYLGLVYIVISLLACIVSIVSSRITKKQNHYIYKIIISIMFIDILSNSVYLLTCNMGYEADVIDDAKNVDQLALYYPEITGSFTGTAYLDNQINDFNISCLSEIESPSFFYSGSDINALYMYERYNLLHDTNSCVYGAGNPLADMMMHTKYQITDKYINASTNWYPKVGSINNLELLENPYSLPLGFVIDETNISKLNSWDRMDKTYNNLFEYQNDFTDSFDIGPLYDIVELEDVTYKDEIEDDKSFYKINEIIENEAKQDPDYTIQIITHLDTADMKPGYYYASLCGKYNYIMYLQEFKEDATLTISLDVNEIPELNKLSESSFKIARLNIDNLKALHNVLSQYTLENADSDGRSVTASINSKTNGILYVSLPYSDSWEITVDDKKTEATPYLGGIGINIREGNHQIKLKFKPDGMYEGITISISTIMILVLLFIFQRRKKSVSENKEKEQK